MIKKDVWVGLNERARKGLTPRNYKSGTLGQRITESGVDAGELTASRSKTELKKVWIPGVEIFSRETHPQRHRGSRSEERRVGKECSSRFSTDKYRKKHETNINIIARRTGKDVNSHTVLEGIITNIMATI